MTVSLGSSAQAGFFIFVPDHVVVEPAGASSWRRKRQSGLSGDLYLRGYLSEEMLDTGLLF
jgi:hypothetical protein